MTDKSFCADENRTDLDRFKEMSNLIQVGWWESDINKGIYTCSDYISEILGMKGNTISFTDFMSYIREDYRELLKQELYEYSHRQRNYFERDFPINTVRGEKWFKAHLIKHIKTNQREGSFGVIQVMNHKDAENEKDIEDSKIDIKKLVDRLSLSVSDFLSTMNENTMIYNILNCAMEFYGAGNAFIINFSTNKKEQICTHEVCKDKRLSVKNNVQIIYSADIPWFTKQILNRYPVIFYSLNDLPIEAEKERIFFSSIGVKSFMAVPLSDNHHVWGFVCVFGIDSYRHWNNDDYHWLLSMAGVLSICIDLSHTRKINTQQVQYKDNMIPHMPVGYMKIKAIFDDEGKICNYYIIEDNEAAIKLLNQKQVHLGIPAFKLYEEKYVIEKLKFLQKVIDNQYYIESNVNCSPGKYCHNAAYVSDKDEIVIFLVDSTETVRAYKAAKRSDKLFHDIFINIPIGEAIYDINGVVRDMNKAFIDIFGLNSMDDVKGFNIFSDKNMLDELKTKIIENDKNDFKLNYDFDRVDNYHTRRKGKAHVNCKLVRLYDDQHTCIGYLLIVIEETDKLIAMNKVKDFENFFSMISSYAKVGYAKINLINHEGYAIRQWYKNMGENEDVPLHNVIGIYNQMHPEDKAKLLDFFEKAKRGEAKSYTAEIRIKRQGSDNKWNWIYKNILVSKYAPEEGIIDLIGVNYDITAFKESELELTVARDKAQAMDKLKSAFLANMSHEIRTPLNAIVGFSELLLDEEDVNERRSYMAIVQENTELLLQLINDILDLSRMEAGLIDFTYTDVDINELCKDIVKSMAPKAKNGVKLIYDHEDIKFMFNTDKKRVHQLILNFISNAIKFTNNGSIRLSYKIADSNNIMFTVTDTGIGISKDNIDKVFDRFVKFNSFIQGTGLGLSICNSIIEQMNGQIGVDSEKDKGSCFWFSLPLKSTKR
jgi:signal transduction histidine kinase